MVRVEREILLKNLRERLGAEPVVGSDLRRVNWAAAERERSCVVWCGWGRRARLTVAPGCRSNMKSRKWGDRTRSEIRMWPVEPSSCMKVNSARAVQV